MRRFISTFVILVWGLWFGGVVTLFIAVASLFVALPHETAGQGAARIFHVFNAYQLVLATLSLLATVVWRVIGPPKLTTALFAFLAIATLAACAVTISIAPRIELLQRQGLTQTVQFKRLHGYSMLAYCGEVVALLFGGLLLPWMRDKRG